MLDAGQGSRSVLLIDEDPRVGRLVKLSLHLPDWKVLICTRHLEGLRLAARQKPDLILMETEFTGIDGIHLGGKLLQAPETQDCAVAFLSSEDSLGRRFRAIQLGASDYLSKPLEGGALGDRVLGIFARLRQRPRGPVVGPAAAPLVARLEQLESEGGCGVISLQRGSLAARIEIIDGALGSAECGPLRGEEALNEIASYGDWSTRLDGAAVSRDPAAAGRRRPITDGTRPAMPHTAKPAIVGSGTVNDDSLARPRPPSRPSAPRLESEPAPDLDGSYSEDDRTMVDPRLRLLDPGRQAEGKPIKSGPSFDADLEPDSEGRFEEDVPTAMSFKAVAADGLSRPGAPPAGVPRPSTTAGPVPRMLAAASGDLRAWLSGQSAPLLLCGSPSDFRRALQASVEQLGFTVVAASTGLEAYTAALQRHPLAILSDQRGPALDGRELLAAIRSDFMVRETPFLMVSEEFLESQRGAVGTAGTSALAPILQGLEAALAPRVALTERLRGGQTTLHGWVEPVGTGHLLQAIGLARLSGQLELSAREERRAEVVFHQGQTCAVSATSGSHEAMGPLGLLHLLAWEWLDYRFSAVPAPAVVQVPLGDRDQIVEEAMQQNNALLARVYQQGFEIEDVSVDLPALEQYLKKLPGVSQALGRRLAAGACAAELVEQGAGTPGQLRSLLHDLRRKSILHTDSLPLDSTVAPRSPTKRRLLVIAVASVITVCCAAGSYFLYKRLWPEQGRETTPSSNTGTHPP